MIRRYAAYLPLLIWLVAVWVLLWGSVTPGVLLSALPVAAGCLAAARLPPLTVRARPRWHRLPVVVARFAVQLVRSSVDVAWTTLRRGPRTRSGVVAVPVRCTSDPALTLAANRLSLVPGTLVLDLDRDAGVLHLFVLDLRDRGEAERARDVAARGTADLLRSLGAEPAHDEEGGGP